MIALCEHFLKFLLKLVTKELKLYVIAIRCRIGSYVSWGSMIELKEEISLLLLAFEGLYIIYFK